MLACANNNVNIFIDIIIGLVYKMLKYGEKYLSQFFHLSTTWTNEVVVSYLPA